MLSRPVPQPKPEKCRVEEKRDRRLTKAEKERDCLAEARRLYGTTCAVPGCKERGDSHHVQPKSIRPGRRFDPHNRRPFCRGHHGLIHAGKIRAWIDDHGELIIEGARKYLEFKL